ncbi:MAG TPA: PPC domain-containing DNA-binding protein [Polyangia bacterium]|nr:PPC domain-containing DNA-binding protein [Polyangia bacterium]
MKTNELESTPDASARSLLVVLAKGEEVVKLLTELARSQRLGTARVTAVGGFEKATLGYFDRERRAYTPIPVPEQAEVLSLVGDIAEGADGQPAVHLHAILGRPDGSTRGGHLLEGHVWPTLEVVIDASPRRLRKRIDPDTGLALFESR